MTSNRKRGSPLRPPNAWVSAPAFDCMTTTLSRSSRTADSDGQDLPQNVRLGEANVSLARSLLELAAEMEQQEREIKRAVLAAVQGGNAPLAARLVRRWLEGPVSEVLRQPSEPALDDARMEAP